MEKFQTPGQPNPFGISFTEREQEKLFGTPIIPNTDGRARKTMDTLSSNKVSPHGFKTAKGRELGAITYINIEDRDNAFAILQGLVE